MKIKQLYKSIVILLILSLLVPVLGLAQETEVKKYTLDELVSAAIINSPSVRSADLNKNANFLTMVNAGKNTAFIPAPGLFNERLQELTNYKLYKTYDISYSISKDTLEVETDKVIKNTISNYYSIFSLNDEMKYLMADYEYKANLFNISTLKYNMGLTSKMEFDSSRAALNIAREKLKLAEKNMEKAIAKLELATNISNIEPASLVYEELVNINEEIKKEEFQRYLHDGLENNLILNMSAKGLKLKELDFEYFLLNNGPKTYEALQEEIRADNASFQSNKNDIESFMKEMIYKVESLVNSYNDLVLKNDLDTMAFNIKKVQYDLGMITKVEFNDAENTLLENQKNFSLIKSNFNEAMFVLKYPHVQLG